MVKLTRLESPWRALLGTLAGSSIARLQAAVPAERRDLGRRYALLRQIHSEFEEMPGLCVTPGQAARLFGLSSDVASRILDRLADARVLRQTRNGQFTLPVEDQR